jgi:hypothetical protein
MARIHTYENDGVVRGNDKWIGSDAQSSNQTKNFTADKVAEYYSSVGTILFPNSVTLRYTEWQNPSGTPSGFIWIFEPSPDTVSFNSVTSFGLSKKDLKVRFFDQLISSFEGDYIYFYNSANPNCYSIYKLILVEDHPDNSNLLKIDVEFVRGNGFLSFNDSFLIGLLDMSVNYSDIDGAPENLSEFNNDVGFITIDDLPAVSLNAIEFSVNHTDALNNEYKAGDVVYYEGRIYKAKFDNDAILPEIGGNTYWLDLGEGARVRQINADWDSTGGDSLILNKPEIPTKTSDLTNDGEDGVNPFISQEQVVEYADLASFPSIGTVGVIYIALDTDLAYVWDPGTMDYVLTSMPDTGITGVGKTNRIAKFSSPTNVTWSKISEDNFGSVKIADSNRSFLNGNTLLSIQRAQTQMDFVLGNPSASQSNIVIDDNTIGTEYRTRGTYTFKTGASYTESFVIGSDGKLKISQTPDTGATSDSLLVRDSSGNVKQIAYPTIPSAGVTSVGLTMPSAFTVTNSPITSSGDITVTGAGSVSQYVRGDGTLANFPNSTGGGASVNYYLNGSVSQGTFGGDTYYQMSKTPILGGGANFIRTNGAGNGYIASFITDAGDPSFLNIPGGNWNLEFYFQSSASGGSPQFYAEIYKVSTTNVFTLVASGSTNPEGITNGTTVDQYYTSIPVPQTSLLITDRLAVRIYVITGGRTITLHTENGNLCEVLTTFTTGLTALNGLTQQVQYFDVGTTGTDFNISSVTDTHTFNLPVASAINTGKLSSTDWTTFNSKQDALGYTPLPTAAGTTTGTVLTFVTDRLYGSIATPETGNISVDTTNAQVGVTNVIIHNSGTAPTFTSPFKKLSGSGNYTTGQINYIFCMYINSTEIIYSINQRA